MRIGKVIAIFWTRNDPPGLQRLNVVIFVKFCFYFLSEHYVPWNVVTVVIVNVNINVNIIVTLLLLLLVVLVLLLLLLLLLQLLHHFLMLSCCKGICNAV